MSLGSQINQLRKEQNFTQDQLAEKLSVSRQTISNWENEIAAPTIDKAQQMAATFGLSLDELLGNTAVTPRAGSLLKKWEGKLCKIQFNEENVSYAAIQYPARIIEVSDTWMTLAFQVKRKKEIIEQIEIVNVAVINSLKEVGEPL